MIDENKKEKLKSYCISQIIQEGILECYIQRNTTSKSRNTNKYQMKKLLLCQIHDEALFILQKGE